MIITKYFFISSFSTLEEKKEIKKELKILNVKKSIFTINEL